MQDKIIKLFYDDIYSEFTINELATKTKISYSYVYRQVEELENKGILIVNQRTNRKYCKPNYSNPEVKTSCERCDLDCDRTLAWHTAKAKDRGSLRP